MTGVPDLAAWLREAVTERLELAKAAGSGTWHTECGCEGECRGYPGCERIEGDDITIYPEGGHDSFQAEHIAANDPADVTAWCEAELAILDEHQHPASDLPCRTVRLLGSGYRGRPGYREEWAP